MESGTSVGVRGKFEKFCCLKIHTSEGTATLYELDQRRCISVTEKQFILDENLFDGNVYRKDRKFCVCDECLQRALFLKDQCILHGTQKHKKTRLDDMKTLRYVDLWQAEENVEWKNLLQHVCNTCERIEDSSARRLTKCTDLVRTEIDNRYISNAALSEALLLLQFSHSKYAVDVFCKTNAAGSFSTVRRTITLLGSEEFCLPQSDVVIGNFDYKKYPIP
ncbi:unnamed protein product [Orchesella dallaii]|uniref:Uncharacterized protein n=1 Tax=Orchesella dallaii TaxID=48710 RepID=A0ABP1R187_9HEXA